MSEYFSLDGHLTDLAFEQMNSDTLTELERLEIAEHLSFCDSCIERYTSFLCGSELLAPPEPLSLGVCKRIRQLLRTIFFNRYVTVGVAACFTMILWTNGVFSPSLIESTARPLSRISSISQTLSEKTSEFSEKLSDNIQDALDQIQAIKLKGAPSNEKK